MTDFFNFLKTPKEIDTVLQEPDLDLLNDSFRSLEEKPFEFFKEEPQEQVVQNPNILPEFPKI